MFRIFSTIFFCQTIYSSFHHPKQNVSQDYVTLQLTLDQANKFYDFLNDSNDNRMLPGMGQTSNMNRRKRKRKRRIVGLN